MKAIASLAVLVATTSAHAKPVNQLRTDLAFSGPGGLIGVRYSRVLSTETRIEPAVGLAYTGVIGSLLVTQPFARRDKITSGGTPYATTFEVYGGYGASVMHDNLHHPWAGREDFVPNGTYHWVDFGLSSQTTFRNWVFTMGTGASILVASPMFEPHEDDHLWFVFPEGWMAKQHWVPTLWSSIGYAF